MDSWNVYPQNAPATPSSAWLCPQNNTQGSEWLHPQSNSTERERNENTALATPTRFIMEYNDLNQTSSSGSYFEGLFEHNFLKLGNQEDLLNNGVYNNEDFSSFLNSNETVVPVTTSVPNISVSVPTTTSNIPTGINSPTPSLVTDDGKDQLYNVQYPVVTSSISGYIADNNQQQQSSTTNSADGNQKISQKNKQRTTSASSPVSPVTASASSSQSDSPVIANKLVQQKNQRERHQSNCPVTIAATTTTSSSYQSAPLVVGNKDLYIQEVQQRLYPSTLSIDDTTLLATSQNLDNQDQYVQSKKHDPKQLLLPLTVGKVSMDSTMSIAITSPSSSLDTDDDIDQYDQTQQRKSKTHRQSGYQDFQLSITTDDLPMQQPSPASSSEYLSSGTKSPPSSHETTPKEKRRRVSQRKRNQKFHEEMLITPVDESHSEKAVIVTSSSGQSSTTVMATMPSESNQSSSTTTSNTAASNSDTSTSSMPSSSDDLATLTSSCVGIKRNILDDGHDETPEEKRARLLERNRIAAAKCRQKKKQAQETLQQQASDLTQKNTGLHSLVNDLREESLRLKNQLLAHSTCNCNVIQEYVRTSGQFAFARPPYTK